tara:strand:+ start:747 stop:2486 length:1740 start_codon:yes stop_codon:yes gene_type:complete
MPRIPTSKPQDVKARPSIGGQVNISSQDAFFKSIAAASAEAGQLFEKAQIEKQQSIDTAEANSIRIFQIEREAELENRLREADVSEHTAIIDEFAAQTQKIAFKPGVSNKARETLQQGNDLWIQGLYSKSMSWSAEKADKQKRETSETLLSNAINSGNIMDAISSIDNMGLPKHLADARKEESRIKIDKILKDTETANAVNSEKSITDLLNVQKESKSIAGLDSIKAYSQDQGTWNNSLEAKYLGIKNSIQKEQFDEASKQIVSSVSLQIAETQNMDGIKTNTSLIQQLLDEGRITLVQANSEREANEARRRTLITEDTTKLRSDLSLLSSLKTQAQQGILNEFELEEYKSTLGNDAYEALLDINKGQLGSKGTDSEEYIDSQKRLEQFISQGSFLGIHWDADKEDLEGINDLITSEDFTQDAKLKLMSTYLAALYKDATKDDILIFASGGESDLFKEFDAKEIHRNFAKHIATKLFDKTAAPRAIVVDGDVLSKEETIDIAKRASAKTSLLDAEDAYDLLSTYWNTAFLQSITDDNYEEQVKSFNNILSEKIRNSGTNIIQRKFNKYRGNISQNYRAK